MHNDFIFPIKGPDRIRKRPAVTFGAGGTQGALAAIKMLLDVFITEAIFDRSDGLDITIHKDGSISVRSDDRGLLLDETIVDGKPNWYWIFCELFAGPREPSEGYFYSLGAIHHSLFSASDDLSPKYQATTDHSFDLCCVQYACAYMHVVSTRDGMKKSLRFKEGYSASELQKEPSQERSGTYIHFLLDPLVFGEAFEIPLEELGAFLKDSAIAIPELKCRITDERAPYSSVFSYPGGTPHYIHSASSHATSLFLNETSATGKDRYNRQEYTAKAKITITFAPGAGEIRCFHNHKQLAHGGRHLDAVKERLLHYINNEFTWDLSGKEGIRALCSADLKQYELSFEDIKENLILILETFCEEPITQYENAAKKAITNPMIADLSHDLISHNFEEYLKENHDVILQILK